MSVILSAGRKHAKKIRKAKVIKPAKSLKGRSQGGTAFESYLPSVNTVVWNHTLDGTQISIAFCKDSAVVWCNDNLMDTNDQFIEGGSQMDFVLFERKARIRIRHRSNSVESNASDTADQSGDGQSNPDADDGSESDQLDSSSASAKAFSRAHGMTYELMIDGQLVPESKPNPGQQPQQPNRGNSTSSIGSTGSFSSP